MKNDEKSEIIKCCDNTNLSMTTAITLGSSDPDIFGFRSNVLHPFQTFSQTISNSFQASFEF